MAERQAIHPVTAAVEGERLIQLVRSLAEFGALPGGMGVDRQALTPDDLAARRFIVERARAAGAAAFQDEAGNFFLRWPGQYDTPAVATGSHGTASRAVILRRSCAGYARRGARCSFSERHRSLGRSR